MSIRCSIIIKDHRNVRMVLYHRQNGGPSGVGDDLRSRVKALSMAFGKPSTVELANALVKNNCGLNDDGYMVASEVHDYINYLYVVNLKTKSVRCFECSFPKGGFNLKELIKRSNLVEIPTLSRPY